MTVYREPPKNNSRRSVGNLDGTSFGMGGTDTVRIQSGTGDFLQAAPTVVDNGYVSAKQNVAELKIQNVGRGAASFARRESDGLTYSFRRIQGGDGVSVTEAGDSLLITAATGAVSFVNLTDAPSTYVGSNGKILMVDEANNRLTFQDPPEMTTSFLELTDTPDSFFGANGKFLTVNSATGKIEFTALTLPTPPARITFAPAPPTNPAPVQGDGWWDTEDGSFYLYYQDANTGQWVESGASEPKTELQETFAYDYGAYYDGEPGPSEVVYRWRAPRAHRLAPDFEGCLFTCGTNPTSNFICTVYVNGAIVGTWTITPSGGSTLVSSVQGEIYVPANQEIKIVAPIQTDATLADLVISFKGERF